MKNLLTLAILLCISLCSFGQPSNDACANAVTLPVNPDCTPTNGTLYQAVLTNPTGTCAGSNRPDVYYRFTVPLNSPNIAIEVTLTSSSSTLTTGNTYTEIFNTNTCPGNSASLGCSNITNTRFVTLTSGSTYLIRIYTTTGTTGGGSDTYNFRVCIKSNNDCTRATTLVPGNSYDGSTFGATASTGAPVDCSTGNPDDDVWYKFTAPYSYASVAITGLGGNLASSGPRMQLFSGTCGSLVSVGCGSTIINATGLTPGDVYFCRVYGAGNGTSGGGYQFKISVSPSSPVVLVGSRKSEVFSQQILSAPHILADPWEVTYGPDNNLWITESKGYRVLKVSTVTGVKDTVLDISQNSTFLPLADRTFNCQFGNGNGAQGGFAGLALHPKFLDPDAPKNFVYVSYVHSQTSSLFFTNRIVRFTYNTSTKKLEDPVSVCDTLPGSNDHNSQRMIIAPVGNAHYLFYASGDMGAGQFDNKNRPIYAQNPESVEGKILRFNLEPDGDAGNYDPWIPSTGTTDGTNPYSASLGRQSSVWSIGIRNNQGFAYDSVLNKLYGSSHGAYSDDEINVIERGKNYGHPLIMGYAADNNANGTTAGAAPWTGNAAHRYPSSCPDIVNEQANALAIGASYKDPLFSGYPQSTLFPSLKALWESNPLSGNGNWPSEGWSGLELYTNKVIPGWKRSLVAASLKWGRLVRLKLDASGEATFPYNNARDTVSYFGSVNRFRDAAFAPNGKDIYVVMDRSTSTSGPSAAFPVVPACQGCLQKYTFLGYNDNAGQSSIPDSIPVADGLANSCTTGTTITIDNTNNSYWVPITGPDGNILAEINSNGQNLGTITSSFYKNTNATRVISGASYADRNITITPQVQPVTPVKVRLYMSKTEYDAFDANPLSGITNPADMRIHKNNDPCQASLTSATSIITPTFTSLRAGESYAFQANISGFSTFYFASATNLLPVNSITFTGVYKDDVGYLRWETKNELNTSYFELERSTGNSVYDRIASIIATGTPDSKTRYEELDRDASTLGVARVFYRLKIVDKDGSYTYSKVVVLDIPGSIITNIAIFPNPADKQTTAIISSPKDQAIKWQLVDVTGRVVLNKDAMLRKGENRIVISLANLRSGTYFLKVNGQFINAKEKIQKL